MTVESPGPARREDLAKRTEHTVLAAGATWSELERAVDEAIVHRVFGICVASGNVRRCRSHARESALCVIATVGFPLGTAQTGAKCRETELALADGADEVDVVIHTGALKSGDLDYVFQDLSAVVEVAGSAPVKAILETGALSQDEKITACSLAVRAGASFLKTSTGFGAGGATVADVQLLRASAGPGVEIKASGGIRTAAFARALVAAGASRIGTSRGIELVAGDPGDESEH